MHNLLYFSPISWNDVPQRPQFLLEELSKYNFKVLFLSCTFDTYVNKEINSQLTVINIPAKHGYTSSRFIRSIMKREIKSYVKSDGYEYVVLSNPIQLDLIDINRDTPNIIYDCMDNMTEFYHGYNKAVIKKFENELCSCANKVICSSLQLKENLKKQYHIDENKVKIIRNGLNSESLAKLREEPSQIQLVEPSLVYVGTISQWFDKRLIKEFALNHETITIYLVGPISQKDQEEFCKIDSIKVIGKVKHEIALQYIKEANVVCIPFINNKLIQCVDPVKLYEYLSLGKPVVSLWWDALEPFKKYDNLLLYSNDKEFEESVSIGLNNQFSIPDRFIDENSWHARTLELKEYLEMKKELD